MTYSFHQQKEEDSLEQRNGRRDMPMVWREQQIGGAVGDGHRDLD